ncbi:MAG: hypothetical protein HY368_02215, partial [Candidatus Aenigmarchaeota archaeon]|nr:hypothetical protein [Candidatus Aenigmarchaeota archaeon]
MCKECFGKGIFASVFAGVFGLLFFSAFWSQQGPAAHLATDWNTTLKIFLKYVVAFWFLGLAKMTWHHAKEIHETAAKPKGR